MGLYERAAQVPGYKSVDVHSLVAAMSQHMIEWETDGSESRFATRTNLIAQYEMDAEDTRELDNIRNGYPKQGSFEKKVSYQWQLRDTFDMVHAGDLPISEARVTLSIADPP